MIIWTDLKEEFEERSRGDGLKMSSSEPTMIIRDFHSSLVTWQE